MPYCERCGLELKEGAKFCPQCGTRLPSFSVEQFSVSGDKLIDKVKELIHEGNVNRIIVKDEKGRTFLEIPVTAALVGIVLAPFLAALGVIAALLTNCTIVVVRREDKEAEKKV